MAISIYERQVQQSAGSGFRQPSSAGQVQQNFRALGRGIVAVAGGVADVIQHEMDANDFAAFQTAKVEAAEAHIRASTALNEKHGVDAMRVARKAPRDLDKELDKIGARLGPRLTEKYRLVRDNESVNFQRAVARKVGSEGEKLQHIAYTADVTTSARKAALITEIPTIDIDATQDDLRNNLRSMRESAYARADHLGVKDKDARRELLFEALDPSHTAAIDGFLSHNDWRSAEKYVGDFGVAMSQDVKLRAEKLIKAKRKEILIETTTTNVLAAADGDLAQALELLKKEDIPTEDKAHARSTLHQKWSLNSMAARETDKPKVATVSRDIWRLNRSPSHPSNKDNMDGLSSQSERTLAKEWYQKQKAVRDSAAHSKDMATAYNLFLYQLEANQLADVPNPVEDPTNPLFDGVDPLTQSRMAIAHIKRGKLTSSELRRRINARLDRYYVEEKMTKAQAEEFGGKLWTQLYAEMGPDDDDLPPDAMKRIVTPMILAREKGTIIDTIPFWEDPIDVRVRRGVQIFTGEQPAQPAQPQGQPGTSMAPSVSAPTSTPPTLSAKDKLALYDELKRQKTAVGDTSNPTFEEIVALHEMTVRNGGYKGSGK